MSRQGEAAHIKQCVFNKFKEVTIAALTRKTASTLIIYTKKFFARGYYKRQGGCFPNSKF